MATQCINEEEGLKCLDYEQGWMSPEEAEAFKRDHLSKCQFCVESLNIMDMALTISREYPEFFNSWHEEPARSSIWRFSTARSFMAAAAMFLFVVAGGLMSYRYYQSSSMGSPYTTLAKFELAPYEMEAMRGGASGDQSYDIGVEALAQREYAKAIEAFKQAHMEQPNNPLFSYYLGLSYGLAGNYKAAIPLLESSQQNASRVLKINGQWYLANAYLKVDRRSDAQKIFEQLASFANSHQSDARAILTRMNELSRSK